MRRQAMLNPNAFGGYGGAGMVMGQMGATRSGYGGGGGRGGLAGSFQDAISRANAANEARFAALLRELRGGRDRALGYAQNLQDIGISDAEKDFTRNLASSEQDLVNRGLRDSSQAGKAGTALTEIMSREKLRARSEADRLRLGADANYTQSIAQAIENRSDQGPDLAMLAQLMQAQGAGGAGAGGYGMPIYGSMGGGRGGLNPMMMQQLMQMFQQGGGGRPPVGNVLGGGMGGIAGNVLQGGRRNRFLAPARLANLRGKKQEAEKERWRRRFARSVKGVRRDDGRDPFESWWASRGTYGSGESLRDYQMGFF